MSKESEVRAELKSKSREEQTTRSISKSRAFFDALVRTIGSVPGSNFVLLSQQAYFRSLHSRFSPLGNYILGDLA